MSDCECREELRMLAKRVQALEETVRDGHAPRIVTHESRITTLEATQARVERQLDLLFAQGQSVSLKLGEQLRILEKVSGLLEHFTRQQTPSVEVR